MSSVETKQLGARADAIELVGIKIHNPDSRSGEVHAEDTVRTKTSVRRTTRKRDVGESAGVRSDLFPYSAKGSTGMMVLHATATNKQSPLQEFQLVSGLGCEDGFPQFVRKLPVNPEEFLRRFKSHIDLQAALRAFQRWDPIQKLLVAFDIKSAHRLVPVQEGDWGLQAFRLDKAEEVFVNQAGTFGITTASFWWGRVAATLFRTFHRVIHATASSTSCCLRMTGPHPEFGPVYNTPQFVPFNSLQYVSLHFVQANGWE